MIKNSRKLMFKIDKNELIMNDIFKFDLEKSKNLYSNI